MRLNIQKLERERKKSGMSMAKFSKNFGLCSSAYSKMLLNQSTALKTLTKMAVVLRLDPRDLLVR
jgi:transcriptional regulator with XRE-family HTH domain